MYVCEKCCLLCACARFLCEIIFIFFLRDTLSDSVVTRDHNTARTTRTFSANKLCSSKMGTIAEVSQEGDSGVGVPDSDSSSIDVDKELFGPCLSKCLYVFCHFFKNYLSLFLFY